VSALLVVEADPVIDDTTGVLEALESMALTNWSLRVLIASSTTPFCSWEYGVMNACCSPWLLIIAF
jgi:hypothetical protein